MSYIAEPTKHGHYEWDLSETTPGQFIFWDKFLDAMAENFTNEKEVKTTDIKTTLRMVKH